MLSSLPLFLFIVHCCCRCKRKLQLPHNLFNALLQMQCVLLCSSSTKQAGSSPWLVPWVLLVPPATRGSPPSEENVSHTNSSGKGSEKKSGLLPNQGGGSGSRRVVKSKTSILENNFLSDQGVPGVRSMGLVVSNKLSEPHVQT